MNPRLIFVAMLLLLNGSGALWAQTAQDAGAALAVVQTRAQAEPAKGVTPSLDAEAPQDVPPATDAEPTPIEPSREARSDTAEFRSGRVAEKLIPIAIQAAQ